MSVKFVSAILGPEMAAPILWAPGKNAFFLQEKTHVHKIPPFRGGGILGGGIFFGGGSADFIFMGARIFLICGSPKTSHVKKPDSRNFCIFCVFVSAFSAFLLCGISSDPYFSGVRGTFRIFGIFAVSGSNR